MFSCDLHILGLWWRLPLCTLPFVKVTPVNTTLCSITHYDITMAFLSKKEKGWVISLLMWDLGLDMHLYAHAHHSQFHWKSHMGTNICLFTTVDFLFRLGAAFTQKCDHQLWALTVLELLWHWHSFHTDMSGTSKVF